MCWDFNPNFAAQNIFQFKIKQQSIEKRHFRWDKYTWKYFDFDFD